MVSSEDAPRARLNLSVVIASFNSAAWLPSTLASLAHALHRSPWEAEVIVVDDGSTDATAEVLETLQSTFPVPLRIVSQENRGRFLARWEGVQAASHPNLLILDSRLIIAEDSLRFLHDSVQTHPEFAVWNGHVDTDPKAPLVGHFWSVPTHLFWSTYLANPRAMMIDEGNFDRVPKGTGFLFIPTQLFRDACLAAWPSDNAHLVSDDTKVLRFVVGRVPIRIDPGFSAIYRPRTSLREFLSHGRNRGTLFVDSYAGTSAVRNIVLVMLVVLPPVFLLALVAAAVAGFWSAFWAVVALGVLVVLAPAVGAAFRRCPGRAILSYLSFVLPFGVAFWAGLARGLKVHRHAFARHTGQTEGVSH